MCNMVPHRYTTDKGKSCPGNYLFGRYGDIAEKVNDRLAGQMINKEDELDMTIDQMIEGMTPEQILGRLLGDFGLEIMDRMPTQFACNCSRERVEKALISIGKKDLREMIAEGKTVSLNCHFCGADYAFDVEDLEKLLRQSR